MDIVITYVNGLDPLWQKDYESAVGKSVLEKRFRDWGTLPYLFRAIEKNLPFAENIYLVVSGESQVPQWVDRDRVKVVLHKDIMPEKLLPVFNSTAIEMYLHRIPGLAEEFVYFNDDFFPVRPCRPEQFFSEGKAVIGMKRELRSRGNLFRCHIDNSDAFARRAAGKRKSVFCLRPQHSCYMALRSACEELMADNTGAIEASVSPLREDYNFNFYLYLDYIHYTGRSINRRISKKHFSLAATSARRIAGWLAAPDSDIVCINDVQMSDSRFRELQTVILDGMNRLFPEKSVYEL